MIPRHEARIERDREQQPESASPPGRRGRFVVAARHEPREQQCRGELQHQIEGDERVPRKSGRHQAGEEGGELQIVGRGRQIGMRGRTADGRGKTRVIVEIGGVGQEIEERVGLGRTGARHHREQRQRQHADAQDAEPVLARQTQARREMRGDPGHGDDNGGMRRDAGVATPQSVRTSAAAPQPATSAASGRAAPPVRSRPIPVSASAAKSTPAQPARSKGVGTRRSRYGPTIALEAVIAIAGFGLRFPAVMAVLVTAIHVFQRPAQDVDGRDWPSAGPAMTIKKGVSGICDCSLCRFGEGG